MSVGHFLVPRDSERTGCGRLSHGVMLVVFAVGIMVWILVGQARARALHALPKTGVKAAGEVVDVQEDRTRDSVRLALSYRFSAGGSVRQIEGRAVADLTGLKRGDPIAVWYDPGRPERCTTERELELDRLRGFPWAAVGLAVVFLLVGGLRVVQVLRPKGAALLSD